MCVNEDLYISALQLSVLLTAEYSGHCHIYIRNNDTESIFPHTTNLKINKNHLKKKNLSNQSHQLFLAKANWHEQACLMLWPHPHPLFRPPCLSADADFIFLCEGFVPMWGDGIFIPRKTDSTLYFTAGGRNEAGFQNDFSTLYSCFAIIYDHGKKCKSSESLWQGTDLKITGLFQSHFYPLLTKNNNKNLIFVRSSLKTHIYIYIYTYV